MGVERRFSVFLSTSRRLINNSRPGFPYWPRINPIMHLRFRSRRPAAISYQQTYNVPPWNGALLRRRSSSISSDYTPAANIILPPPPLPILPSFPPFPFATLPLPVPLFPPLVVLLPPTFFSFPSLLLFLPWNAAYFLFRAFIPSFTEYYYVHLVHLLIRILSITTQAWKDSKLQIDSSILLSTIYNLSSFADG